MTLDLEWFVERVSDCPRRVVGNDALGTLCGNGRSQRIGIVGCIIHYDLGWMSLDERLGLRRITNLLDP